MTLKLGLVTTTPQADRNQGTDETQGQAQEAVGITVLWAYNTDIICAYTLCAYYVSIVSP